MTSDVGYLQIKIRELNEEVRILKFEIEKIREENIKLKENLDKINISELLSLQNSLKNWCINQDIIAKDLVKQIAEINRKVIIHHYKKMIELLKNKMEMEIKPFVREECVRNGQQLLDLGVNTQNLFISNLNSQYGFKLPLQKYGELFTDKDNKKVDKWNKKVRRDKIQKLNSNGKGK